MEGLAVCAGLLMIAAFCLAGFILGGMAGLVGVVVTLVILGYGAWLS